MKKELMTLLGVDEGIASRAVGVLSASDLATICNFARTDAKCGVAMGAAIPHLITGKNISAVIAAVSVYQTSPAKMEEPEVVPSNPPEPSVWKDEETANTDPVTLAPQTTTKRKK